MSTVLDPRSCPRSGSSRTPGWRHPWIAGGLACFVMLALAADRSVALRPSGIGSRETERQPVGDDSVTDQFLQQFLPLRENTRRRRAMAAEVVAAATENRLDFDLLFALIAVESGFDRTAVSRKGARGLGQVMFPTARAVAPMLVHEPRDLYDTRRNLAVTAQYLRELLLEGGGNLRAALTMYHTGARARRLPTRGDDRYVGLICTYYASLKARRRYGEMVAPAERTTGSPEG